MDALALHSLAALAVERLHAGIRALDQDGEMVTQAADEVFVQGQVDDDQGGLRVVD
jgi:hypothetical protein